jgi:ABC-2 type transport system permease protein
MSIVPTFILTPLTFLGGVFYSVQQFSPFWRTVSLFNPILYMVNAFRWGFLGVSDMPLGICYAVLIGFSILFAVIIGWLFRAGKGLRV